MADATATPDVDLNAIQAEVEKEIAGMDESALQADLLKFRVRQKKQQKKQQGTGAQKAYQLKQRAKFNAMKAQAIKLGLWDKINEEAEAKAEAELGDEAAPETEDAA